MKEKNKLKLFFIRLWKRIKKDYKQDLIVFVPVIIILHFMGIASVLTYCVGFLTSAFIIDRRIWAEKIEIVNNLIGTEKGREYINGLKSKEYLSKEEKIFMIIMREKEN